MVNTQTRASILGTACLFILLGGIPFNCSAQVTSNVIKRVLLIQVANETGTAFTCEVDGRQYIVTAKHLVSALKDEDSILIYAYQKWQPFPVKVLKSRDPIDVAVLIPRVQMTVTFPLPLIDGPSSLIYSQELFFLGFPYGLNLSDLSMEDGNLPIPFVKRAILANFGGKRGGPELYLDGHNNPGFSGGPVVVKDSTGSFRLAGVISGFQAEYAVVYKPEEVNANSQVAKHLLLEKGGKRYRLNPTEQIIRTNTGIIEVWSILHALDLIKGQPTGPRVGLPIAGNDQESSGTKK